MSSLSMLDTQTPRTPEVYLPASLQPATIWGRLYARVKGINSYDLSKSIFTLGRNKNSDIVIKLDCFPKNSLMTISKTHFTITKEPDLPIMITDCSKNGTFVNGKLIGKNNTIILQNDDEIAIGVKDLKVFSFKTIQTSENTYLPIELRQRYEISKEIGKGACGEVTLIFDKFTCQPFAVKKIVKALNAKDNKLNHPNKIKNEINILQSINYPFVISTKDIVETQEAVFIVMEYLEGGELTTYIKNDLTEKQCKFLFHQMVLAVQYLHNQGIIHRDLKPENVLLKEINPNSLLKITDFGLSKIINNETVMKTICGTLTYVAPEILDKTRVGSYDQAVDVWSLGVILYYMLSKQLPFYSADRGVLIKRILNGKIELEGPRWSAISREAKNLILRILVPSPAERITLSEIITHPWIFNDFATTQLVQNLLYEERETAFVTSDIECELSPKRKKISEDID